MIAHVHRHVVADQHAVKLFIDPTVVLTSIRCNDEVIDRLDPEGRNTNTSVEGRSDQTRLPYLLECRPPAEFNRQAALDKLVDLRIGQQDGPAVSYVVPGEVLARDDEDAGDGDGPRGQTAREPPLPRSDGQSSSCPFKPRRETPIVVSTCTEPCRYQ